MIENGGPAFPPAGFIREFGTGMTLRDYFAAKAMQARLSDWESLKSLTYAAKDRGHSFADEVAQQSYDMADAMLKERTR